MQRHGENGDPIGTGIALTLTELDLICGGVLAPRDATTGMATGRRVELPIHIVTPVGMAS